MNRKMGIVAVVVMIVAAIFLSSPGQSGAISTIRMGATDTAQFATGGVGRGERDEMMKMAHDYNLKLVFSSGGRYLSDVGVVIRKPGGNTILSAESNGPWMYVKLPAGSYVVESTCRGATKSSRVQVGQGLQSLVFDWKQKAGM